MKRSGFLKTLAIGTLTPTVISKQTEGISVEVKSVSLLPDSEFLTPTEVLNLFNKTGNIIYRRVEK